MIPAKAEYSHERLEIMRPQFKSRFCLSFFLLAAFMLWTAAVRTVDVQPIGPLGSSVGFATLNLTVHQAIGVNMTLYTLTDWLSLAPLIIVAGFGLLGLGQWIRRKSIRKVDFTILALGGFYIVVLAVFLLFEELAVNYRPVLIGGVQEASYPSSTTMLVMCVVPTAMMQLHTRIRNRLLRRWANGVLAVFLLFMVLGRILSGVHWITDVIGGALLSAGLVALYRTICTPTPNP